MDRSRAGPAAALASVGLATAIAAAPSGWAVSARAARASAAVGSSGARSRNRESGAYTAGRLTRPARSVVRARLGGPLDRKNRRRRAGRVVELGVGERLFLDAPGRNGVEVVAHAGIDLAAEYGHPIVDLADDVELGPHDERLGLEGAQHQHARGGQVGERLHLR